ncbi:hypothetical protein RJ639_040526 [Escallonia herrerae]|uniref:Protein FAR1-RELATED SEQUENCE n=1 Tax=Escallonia herrerae TaxID=1293975 RepID=A0AA88WEC7_9ASTE|nr:hypothetical protein RJ639_040526 [Escallonia herrerae]
MWVVDKFENIHNHPLSATPSKVVKHRSHSKYHHSAVCKRLVYTLNQKGLKLAQITRVVNAMKPGEEANITVKQSSSIISSGRKNNFGRECYGIVKHFQEKAVSDGYKLDDSMRHNHNEEKATIRGEIDLNRETFATLPARSQQDQPGTSSTYQPRPQYLYIHQQKVKPLPDEALNTN